MHHGEVWPRHGDVIPDENVTVVAGQQQHYCRGHLSNKSKTKINKIATVAFSDNLTKQANKRTKELLALPLLRW